MCTSHFPSITFVNRRSIGTQAASQVISYKVKYVSLRASKFFSLTLRRYNNTLPEFIFKSTCVCVYVCVCENQGVWVWVWVWVCLIPSHLRGGVWKTHCSAQEQEESICDPVSCVESSVGLKESFPFRSRNCCCCCCCLSLIDR